MKSLSKKNYDEKLVIEETLRKAEQGLKDTLQENLQKEQLIRKEK